MKRMICLVLAFFLMLSTAIAEISAEDAAMPIDAESDENVSIETNGDSGAIVYAGADGDGLETAAALELDCRSVILMEANTGTVLYEENADEALSPASVTKIMTLLLVMEAIDGGTVSMTDMVTVSAHAASMGGSQVYLKEGEQMTVEDLLKSVVIASANDAAVALAEYVAGSEESFVARMNSRAAELGATTARFENTNGLDDTAVNHVMSARDIAVISQALILHKEILTYSSTWMDTIRDGAFGLTNTNRLVRFYRGCTGLKTGSTAKAGFCVSVTAERDGLSLICVIMGAATRDSRNASATKLLDWGFANFALAAAEGGKAGTVRVTGGTESAVSASYPAFSAVVAKAEKGSVHFEITLDETVAAAVAKGQKLGEIVYYCGDRELGRADITADTAVPKISYGEILKRMLRAFLLTGGCE